MRRETLRKLYELSWQYFTEMNSLIRVDDAMKRSIQEELDYWRNTSEEQILQDFADELSESDLGPEKARERIRRFRDHHVRSLETYLRMVEG